jgi:hypothetical protein
MTKYLTIILVLFAVKQFYGQADIKFEHDTIWVDTVTIEMDTLGQQVKDHKVETNFIFKNIGDKPLIITNSQGSGSGFAYHYPIDPVLPNHTDTIKVVIYRFKLHNTSDYKNGEGYFTTCITITGNFKTNQRQICVSGYRKKKIVDIQKQRKERKKNYR